MEVCIVTLLYFNQLQDHDLALMSTNLLAQKICFNSSSSDFDLAPLTKRVRLAAQAEREKFKHPGPEDQGSSCFSDFAPAAKKRDILAAQAERTVGESHLAQQQHNITENKLSDNEQSDIIREVVESSAGNNLKAHQRKTMGE